LSPVEEKKEEKKNTEVTALPGTSKILVNKADREEVFFFAPTKVNKKTTQKSTEAKNFTHTLDTIGLFAALKLSAPSSVKDIEPTISSLEHKIADLKKKQVEVIAERKAKRSEKEAALAEATKVADAAKAEWNKVAPKDRE